MRFEGAEGGTGTAFQEEFWHRATEGVAEGGETQWLRAADDDGYFDPTV